MSQYSSFMLGVAVGLAMGAWAVRRQRQHQVSPPRTGKHLPAGVVEPDLDLLDRIGQRMFPERVA